MDPVLRNSLKQAGLRPELIERHQRNVKSYLDQQSKRFFPIADTCRLDNGGILPLPAHPEADTGVGVAAFIPAAGASTRYVAPLEDLARALENEDEQGVQAAFIHLRQANFLSAPLPKSLQRLLREIEAKQATNFSTLGRDVLRDLSLPKALYPAVPSGETFLEIKRHEHQAIGGLAGEVYITPQGQVESFEAVAKRVNSPVAARFYEQGRDLCTVRFDRNANCVITEDHLPSIVPNGHGALLRLFNRVPRDFPEAQSVFIRNIDNISGTSDVVLNATRRFIDSFKTSLNILKALRFALRSRDVRAYSHKSIDLMNFWGLPQAVSSDAIRILLESLFHSTPRSIDHAEELINRPFVLMGQVPNTGRDVGGSCVFAHVEGVLQKICLELPHASPDDQDLFLKRPERATHFNPVFVAVEIPNQDRLDELQNNPFWLVSKKTWKGADVYYQESILYELLGSSQFTNVIFTEIPRLLFNPHKTLHDAKDKSFSDWVGV